MKRVYVLVAGHKPRRARIVWLPVDYRGRAMRILLSGASGMIGTAVGPYLKERGHDVVRLVRRDAGPGEVYWDPDGGKIDSQGVEGFHGVVHLATMRWPLRWTANAKAAVRENRVRCNSLLAETLARCESKPSVFVFASGMGIYPSSGDAVLTEVSALGHDFLAGLQRDGEAVVSPAAAAGVRVVALRIPTVLGGNIRRLGRVGDGRQWMSWVSRSEMGHIIEHALLTETLTGPVNACSPYPERNAEFAAILGRSQGKGPGISLPAFLLRVALGEMADSLILASRRMYPQKLLDSGYEFRYPLLGDALAHELAPEAHASEQAAAR